MFISYTGGQRMRPETRSKLLLAITRSKAKMYEYHVPKEHHIEIPRDPVRLFSLSIGFLGDFSARTNLEAIDDDYIDMLRENLQFSARFFDAYLQSRLDEELDPYLLLLGAASYYMCGLPGSSLVLAKRLGDGCPDLNCLGLGDLLLWLLKGDLSKPFDGFKGPYGKYIGGISQSLTYFFENGNGQDNLFENASYLRKTVYDNGTPRQLLFADIICAVVRNRFKNSTWFCLPQYSGISIDQWLDALHKKTFIRELWPAQHLLGEKGVFRGKSAVIQMPTSAGKTRATEIIVRSAFIAERASLAVIVAPFRALCHEIRNSFIKAFSNEPVYVNELSDVLQADFDFSELASRNQVMVVTPEKLIYVLRHAPELAKYIGLLIYDEGHQFDSGTRGITYELLLASLKTMVPREIQTILISAVISNSDSIGNWLNGDDSEVVSGTYLIPTYRTVAFASWQERLGRLEFVSDSDPDKHEFFVPRIIKQQQLQLSGRERNERVFPDKTDGQSIALYLGLKVVENRSVAVFCGRKDTASNLCKKIVDAYNRGLNLTQPLEYSNKEEVNRLRYLYERHFGKDAIATQSAALGIFAHHGNTPHGIRLAVEYAMKEGFAKFVICTSTLAQGVNLPIRYLIVTSVYQGAERIKVRDFHNLLGRAGRAGMHTEGSILFADPGVYDRRMAHNERWRWEIVKELLMPSKSEPCTSMLLSLFEPIHRDDNKYFISMEPLELVHIYIENAGEFITLPEEIESAYAGKGFTRSGIERQIEWRMNIISSIESYLMSNWNESSSELQEDEIIELAKGTLAYFLANEEQQEQIIEVFKLLAQNIEQNVSEPKRRKIFGKTLYGVWTSIKIENWIKNHIEDLVLCEDQDKLLWTLWPVMAGSIRNTTFRKCDTPEVLKEVALGWIHGKPFHELYEMLSSADARLIAGTQHRSFKLDHIVDICENAFAYDGTHVVGAIAELIELVRSEDTDDLIHKLQELQKRLKYGLDTTLAVILFELGFADRVVSMDLSSIIDISSPNKNAVLTQIKQRKDQIAELLRKYPSYFTERLNDFI